MRSRTRRFQDERGAVALIVAIVMAVLIGFLGLTLFAGHGSSVRGELQNATDAAALAAARQLNGQLTGWTSARQLAANYTGLHDTDGTRAVTINSAADVSFGVWNFAASTFTPTVGTSNAELLATNAVRVQAGREASRGNALPVWLASFLGSSATKDVRAASVAVGGGPCQTNCVIPLAFASCSLVDASGALVCNQTLVFKNNNNDTAGLTGLGSGANTSVESVILKGAARGTGCADVHDGDTISIQNGNNFNPLYNDFKALEGRTVSAPVVTPSGCPNNPTFNQSYPVIGFASFTINHVGGNGNDLNCPGGKGPCVVVTLDCNQTTAPPAQVGCGYFGLTTTTSQLVQ